MPASTDTLPIEQHTLDNGIRVILQESRAAPVAAIQVWVDVGAADEREVEGGIAHVHEHMLFKGTERRPVGQIAAEIEGAGGEINAWTSLDATVYHVVVSSRHFETGVDILSDAILHSAFDPEELERELGVILEEIKRAEDSPQSRVSRALFSTAFTAHPYRRPVIGQAEVVAQFSREQILEFYRSNYRPDRLTVVAVGDFDASHALSIIARAFAPAQGTSSSRAPRATEPTQTEVRSTGLVDEVEETQLAVGWHGPSIAAEDLFAVDVLGVMLGSGESSRLVHRLRHELRVVNEVYAYAYTPRDNGLFVIGAALHHAKLHDTLRAIGEVVRKAQESPPPPQELSKAQGILAADGVYQRETVEGLARRLGYWSTSVGDPGYEEKYQEGIRAVTPEDIQRVARKYLSPQGATIVALVPRQQESVVDDEGMRAALAAGLRPAPSVRGASRAADAGQHRLSTGARVMLLPDHSNPIVSMRCVWLGGLRLEDAATAGYSNLGAELLLRGTRRLSSSEVSRSIDAMAAHIDGSGGRNSIGVRGTFLKERFTEGSQLLAQCLTEPAFAPEELERTRALVLEELRARADNPAGLAFDLFNKCLWDQHPYRLDVLGNRESLLAATQEKLRGFCEGMLTADGAVISVVGAFDAHQTLDLLEEMVSGLGQSEGLRAPPGDELPLAAPRTARLVRDRAQAHIVLGYRGLSLNDPDRHALELLCSVLSGQGGRLFLELRDRQSLCYTVNAFSVEGIEPGSFTVYMGTSPEKVPQAIDGIDRLLGVLCDEGITAAELSRAQKYLVGTHDIGLQRLGARAATTALNELYGLGWDAHLGYAHRIEAVTLEDVRRVAQRLIDPRGRVLTLVGPEDTPGPEADWQPERGELR